LEVIPKIITQIAGPKSGIGPAICVSFHGKNGGYVTFTREAYSRSSLPDTRRIVKIAIRTTARMRQPAVVN